MVCYEGDFCHRLKQPGETWILGLAAESVGATTARRELLFRRGGMTKAIDYLAAHFCSDECRQNCMAQLFGGEPLKTEVVEEVASGSVKKIVREYAGTRVETVVRRRKPV